MSRRKLLPSIGLGLLIVFTCALFAPARQAAAPAGGGADAQKVRKLLELSGSGDIGKQMMDQMFTSFRRAMPICAGVLVLGAVLAWCTVRSDALEHAGAEVGAEPERAGAAVPAEGAEGVARAAGPPCRPECAYHCGVSAPPLDPGERRPRT